MVQAVDRHGELLPLLDGADPVRRARLAPAPAQRRGQLVHGPAPRPAQRQAAGILRGGVVVQPGAVARGVRPRREAGLDVLGSGSVRDGIFGFGERLWLPWPTTSPRGG